MQSHIPYCFLHIPVKQLSHKTLVFSKVVYGLVNSIDTNVIVVIFNTRYKCWCYYYNLNI